MEYVSLGHPTLDEALVRLASTAPQATARAMAALDVLLAGVNRTAWSDVAWLFSRLTGGGFPVELTFTSTDEDVRYATEVAGPEMAEVERLPHAEHMLVQLGAPPLAPEVSALLRHIQAAGPLRFGAWVSGRHSALASRYKLYVEVPRAGSADVEAWVWRLVGEAPWPTHRQPELWMIGYEPESSRTELYFRVDELESWEVKLLMQRVGLGERHMELIHLLEEAHDRPVQPRLPGARFGFSYSIAPHSPVVFSVFTAARTVFGTDRCIRQHLLEMGIRKGWGLRNYAAVSEVLATRHHWNTYHTVATFAVPPRGPLMLYVGLRPPEVDDSSIA